MFDLVSGFCVLLFADGYECLSILFRTYRHSRTQTHSSCAVEIQALHIDNSSGSAGLVAILRGDN